MKIKIATFAAVALCLTPSIHAQEVTPTPTPVGYVDAFKVTGNTTLVDRQTRTASRVGQRMVTGESQLLTNYRALYNEVWHNPDGLNPQQVCDALGAKATNLFVIAGTMANALYQIDPNGIGALINVPPGYSVTLNAGGTVSIAHTPPTTAPSSTP